MSYRRINPLMLAALVAAMPPESLTVADCDVCGKRPGTHKATVTGIETWVCDECGGRDDTLYEAKP